MKCLSPLPDELREHVLQAMLPGEAPVWVAQPVPTLVNQLSSPYIFFGCLGLFFFVLVSVLIGPINPYAFIILLLTGMAVGMVFLTRRRMGRTIYLITEKRAIVLRPSGLSKKSGWQVIDWPLSPGLVKERVLRSNGSGDLIFGYEPKKSSEDTTVPMGFFNLPELRRVEQLLMSIAPPSRN